MTRDEKQLELIYDLLRVIQIANREQIYWKINEVILELYEKYPWMQKATRP